MTTIPESLASLARRTAAVVRLVPNAIYKGGGLGSAMRRAATILRRYGLKGVMRSVGVLLRGEGPPLMADETRADRHQYREWVKRHDPPLTAAARERITQRMADLPTRPAFALVMPLVEAEPQRLRRAIDSARAQVYPDWVLQLVAGASTSPTVRSLVEGYAAEDSRIRVVDGPLSGAVDALAAGWLALLGSGDVLAEDALYQVAEVIAHHPEVRLIYSDEDRIDDAGLRSAAYFKPDWSIDLFRSQNLFSRLGVFEVALVREAGGLPSVLDPVGEYDLALRCVERVPASAIHHVQKLLYHRRVESVADTFAMDGRSHAPVGGEEALRAHLQRIGVRASVEPADPGYRVRYALPDVPPRVSLIIPTRNGERLVRQCIESILSKTTYPDYEIILVDNGSDDPGALAYFDELAQRMGVRVLRDDSPFNYSALNNRAVAVASGDVVGLINNDVEVISPDWLSEMIGIVLQPGVGAVGARLWYPDKTLQHAGVLLGVGADIAAHAHRGLHEGEPGYFGRAALTQSFSAVTAACLIVRKDLYQQVGGLDEVNLHVAYNDVDFCLKLIEAGYRNVWTPHAELFHHESATRSSDLAPSQRARFDREVRYMKNRWGRLLGNDPAYNPNLTALVEDFGYAWPPRAPLKT